MTTKFSPGTWLSGGQGSWLIADERGVPQPARHYAIMRRLSGQPIPPRPDEAKGYRLFSDHQRALIKAFEEGKLNGRMTLRQIAQALAKVMRS